MIRKKAKNAQSVLIFCILILLAAMTWEYISGHHSDSDWVRRFENRLHKQEVKADKILEQIQDTLVRDRMKWDRDLIVIGLKDNHLFFWTDEIVGMEGVYQVLTQEYRFFKINNAYYEIRGKKYGDTQYYALLHIKDDYPYTNKYVKNHFGKFLKVKTENTDHIEVSPSEITGGIEIRSQEGETLFYIKHSEDYKDRSLNYLSLFFYLLFFLTLFHLYDFLQQGATSLKRQLFYVALFSVFLLLLHYFMYSFRLPDSLYRLRIFDMNKASGGPLLSVGDMMISVFSICQMLYISFANLRIDYENSKAKCRRYLILAVAFFIIIVYMIILTYTIDSLINSEEVYLNIARIIEVDAISIVAFISIVVAGLGMVILMDGSVNILKNLLPPRHIVVFGVVILLLFALVAFALGKLVLCIGSFLVLAMYLLVVLNCFVPKREVQRSIYLAIMFLLSVYIVLIAQHFEQEREQKQRVKYAQRLQEERDYSFEKILLEMDRRITHSDILADLVAGNDEELLEEYLSLDMLDMTGYNYNYHIILCRELDSLHVKPEGILYGCNDYFDNLIHNSGIHLEDSHFYAIDAFDGLASYVGKFTYGGVSFFLRFDSAHESEGNGYPEILSRRDPEDFSYPYSYAKYKNGQLIYSSGFFNYYRSLDILSIDYNLKHETKDNYSHMLFPVNEDGVLIISLHESFFSFYYQNVLYVFLICIVFSSYGIFFNLNTKTNFRRGTLKSRIKNSILSLVLFLFVFLTFFSIAFTTKSYARRHNVKMVELMKFLNKELETFSCVEYMQCNEIIDELKRLSEVMLVDINIYSEQGRLVSTSRPEIYTKGFAGYLVDPEAYDRVVNEKVASCVVNKKMGDLPYLSGYMPLMLDGGRLYILNVPYFAQNDELNQNIFILIVVVINIAVIVMVLTFILSEVVAERVTKPLELVNHKLKRMRIGGKNEKITYDRMDEVGALVREYNNMVDKVDDSVELLARSERENAWREMARQIAHEIKNPLTPMRLNVQFMQRSLQIEDPEEFKVRFKDISNVLIEQIDNMASIASAFSDFAKISESRISRFDISELAVRCVTLFENNVCHLDYDIEQGVLVFADKEQIHRVFVNILKNAVQSIPEDREGKVEMRLKSMDDKVVVSIRDNGRGISKEAAERIFEPNFTTKSNGAGLGLAISKRIVESVGGHIEFVSTELGTEFFIVLPLGTVPPVYSAS